MGPAAALKESRRRVAQHGVLDAGSLSGGHIGAAPDRRGCNRYGPSLPEWFREKRLQGGCERLMVRHLWGPQ